MDRFDPNALGPAVLMRGTEWGVGGCAASDGWCYSRMHIVALAKGGRTRVLFEVAPCAGEGFNEPWKLYERSGLLVLCG